MALPGLLWSRILDVAPELDTLGQGKATTQIGVEIGKFLQFRAAHGISPLLS
jgi:hypothetical protein